MAEIRCPNCKTMNPANARICKKCGHALTDESTGWLDSLRGGDNAAWDEPEPGAKAEEPIQPEDETPDWLQRIRQRNQEEQDQTKSSTPGKESGEELPDWLRDIQNGSSASGTAAQAGGEEDWLRSLRGPEEPFSAETPAAPETPFTSGPSDETPADSSDWMQNQESWKTETGEEAAEPPIAPASAAPEENDQDWLSKLSQIGDNPPAAADSKPQPGAEEPTPASSESDMDWLAGLQAATGATPEPSAEEPTPASSESDMDWLAGLQAATGATPEPGGEEPGSAAPEFDWMSGLPGESQASETTPEPPTGPEASFGESTFPWESEPSTQPAADEPAETPDWLRKFEIKETPAGEARFETPGEAAQPDAALPDWLSNLPAQETGAAETPASGEPADEFAAESQEGVPDWLTNFTPTETSAQPGEPVTPISEEPQEESFSWESFGVPAEAGPASAEESSEMLPFAGANLPEWLEKSSEGEPPRLPYDHELIPPAEPAGNEKADENVPFVAGALPSWLDESGAVEPADQAASEEPPEGGEQPLEAAELPSWLQSMRPIEMVAPKSVAAEEKHVEKAGPLAGLSGVLPTEDLIGQYIKPPLYSVKLRVSEKQRVHASLIESLISEETQAQPVPAERSEAPQRVLRFLVAIVLILAILLPLLNFLPTFPEAGILPQELVDFSQTLSDPAVVPPDSAVLLAVEYEPGLSGELQTASEAVIRKLAEQNVRLTIISTSPTGPVLAESLLQQSGFDAAWVVNLGYLAGGSTGLQSFGLSPSRAAPVTLQGDPATWNDGVLAGVSSLSDFTAVIVLTDDPDKGRNWVEQIQGVLGDTPMLMVSSAQASPLLLPYYNSGQVKGIISGISGAASFESLVDSSGTATLLRGSYQYGMLLAALLILVGGLVTGIITSITRGKAEKEA